MSSGANAAVFRAVVDALAKGRIAVRDTHPGLAANKPECADLFGATPQHSIEMRGVIADDDWLAARLVLRVSHAGVRGQNPPMDLWVNREAIVTCRFTGGVIVELHCQSNPDRQWSQLRVDEGTDD